jgi:hypothetical protein
MPYRTTILAGRVDLGSVGIKAMGLAWLVVGLGCAVTAFGLIVDGRWAIRVGAIVLMSSALLSIVGWPGSRLGLPANLFLAAGLVALAVAGARADWRASSAAVVGAWEAGASGVAQTFVPSEARGLPPPVERYFRRVLSDGQPMVLRAQFDQAADFYMTGRSPGWRPLTATQHFAVGPAAFVWDARIRLAPMTTVWVRDHYSGGTGSMRADFMGLWPVMRTSASPELNAGALQRYLAELIWLPTALLPSAGVAWSARDDRSAMASLTDSGTRVELEFRFNESDEIAEIFAAGRFREEQGAYLPTPWLVRCWDYQWREGMRIPIQAEVAWLLPEGPQPYWRGRLTSARYTLAR